MSIVDHAVSPLFVKEGAKYSDVISEAGLPLSGPTAIVVVRDADGNLKDLDTVAMKSETIEPVPMDSPDGLYVLRHSCAHVMAQAVQRLHKDAKLGIGPPVQDGFYYDFDVESPFTPEDLKSLESEMLKIIKEGQRFRRRVIEPGAAQQELYAEPYKIELIGLKSEPAGVDNTEVMEVGAGELTMYDNLNAKDDNVCWTDLCRGPHIPSTRLIPAFKLMRSAAAYWRGSEKNPQLQRIYGTAWPTRDALKEYLHVLEEAAKRDHRRLGTELDLFSFPDEIGSGLPVFHPKGGILRKTMEDYSRAKHVEAEYSFVNSPHITKANLFEVSGHLGWYKDGMFPPMHLEDGGDYYVKPMNCPFHNLIFKSRGRSYRELPLRLFEFGSVYRYEKSGVVHGLTRVRGMTQDDAHIYCAQDQMTDEIARVLQFVLDLLRDYGLNDFYLEISDRDDSEKFIGEPAEWERATNALREVAMNSGLELVEDPGGAAFYGPKISVQAKDAIGRTWQMSTVQVDFQLPNRFDLEYAAADGSRQRPIMIHRALFGSVERFIGVLIEHYAGAFPFWLSPVQVVGIPIADGHVAYLNDFAQRLGVKGIRVEVDESDDRMQKKIRNAQKQKVPVMVIAGDTDVEGNTVSFRFRDGSQRNGVPHNEAVDYLINLVESRSNTNPTAD